MEQEKGAVYCRLSQDAVSYTHLDGCEVLVCTHVDREHIHSHCVINSVNFETGKKLHMAKEQIQELMRRNDMICQEMGLPVFESTAQQARGMSGAEYHLSLIHILARNYCLTIVACHKV